MPKPKNPGMLVDEDVDIAEQYANGHVDVTLVSLSLLHVLRVERVVG